MERREGRWGDTSPFGQGGIPIYTYSYPASVYHSLHYFLLINSLLAFYIIGIIAAEKVK